MKRIGMGVLVVLTIVALCVASVQAAQISVEPSYLSVGQEDTFTVNITVDPEGIGVLGAEYKLFYDNILFKVLTQNKGPFLSQDGASTSQYTNTIDDALGEIEYAEAQMIDAIAVTTSAYYQRSRLKWLETLEMVNFVWMKLY